MNKKIIIVSPGYLHAAKKELKKYSFSICGYGNPDLAYKKLICINKRDIIGCLLIYDDLNISDFKYLLRFIKMLQQVYMIPIVLCTTKQISSQQMNSIQKFGKVICHTTDEITDVSFNKSIAYILMKSTYTYKFQEDVVKSIMHLPDFKIQKLMTDEQLAVLSNVSIRNTFSGTVKYDPILNNLNMNKSFRVLRLAKIMSCTSELIDQKDIMSIVAALSKLESDRDMFIQMSATYFKEKLNDKL